ncbi:MAG: hypothetical protein H7269_06475 [Cellulomonas sp.]|nr:hypothetical protein [Cellulomonas sp.]
MAFDNIEAGVFSTPSLSSVNQQFEELGALAGRLGLATIDGEDVPSTVFTSLSVVVAVSNGGGPRPGPWTVARRWPRPGSRCPLEVAADTATYHAKALGWAGAR